MARRRRRRPSRLESAGHQAMSDAETRQRAWVPERHAEHRVDDGLVVVRAPKFKGPLGRGLVSLAGKDQEYNLRLDGFGSATWELMDGERDLGEICEELVGRFGKEVEPAMPRLVEFIRLLHRAHVVRVTTRENAEGKFK